MLDMDFDMTDLDDSKKGLYYIFYFDTQFSYFLIVK